MTKGFIRLSPQRPEGPAARATVRGAGLVTAGLSFMLATWLYGCVPSGQTSTPSTVSPVAASSAPSAESPSQDSLLKHPPERVEDSRTPSGDGRIQRDRQPEPFAGLPSSVAETAAKRQADRISAEKLSGFLLPAEYLFMPSPHYPEATIAVMLPSDYDKDPKRKYPLVIAFGGAGECARTPEKSALAWLHYYKTDAAVKAAERGTLTRGDFYGFVTDRQLAVFNRTLKHRPYTGVILACPSSPLLWGIRNGVDFPSYEAFVIKELVPELRKRYRVDPTRIGVDGVSMGGARALYYGLKYPAIFSSVGTVQGAFGPFLDRYRELIKNNREILAHRPIQLVTSDGDVMLPSVRLIHQMLQDNSIPHRFLVLPGPHDYIFNQGPGALALLLFHHQVLTAPERQPVH